MWLTIVGVVLLSLLALLVLPVPRVRRLLLTAASRFSQAALLGGLGACGAFLVQPNAAPDWTRVLLDPATAMAGSVWPDPTVPPGLPWLVLAVVVVVVSLPLLIALDLALSLTQQADLVHSFRKELRFAASWLDTRLVDLGLARDRLPLYPEAAAVAEAFRMAGQSSSSSTALGGPIVLDLLK